MLTVFRNCANLLISKCKTKRKLTFAILGIDDAGKTTTAKGLSGENNHSDTTVTIGFDKVEIKLDKYEITLFDLGGGKKIRDIWHNYLTEVFGIVFVIDSSKQSRMEETKEVLSFVLKSPYVVGKPLLVLANKQDQEGAMDELDVCDILSLESLVNQSKCPCRVESCSASLGSGRKLDKNITKGMMWLCNIVDLHYDVHNARIMKEMKVKNEQKKIEDEERKIRVKKIREEREKHEASIEQVIRQLTPDSETGDPFKRLDGSYFTKQKTNETNIEKVLNEVDNSKEENLNDEKCQLLPEETNSESNKNLPTVSKPLTSKQQPDKKKDIGLHCKSSKSDSISRKPSPEVDAIIHTKSTILQPLDKLTKLEKVKRKKRNNIVPMKPSDDKEPNTTSTSLTFIASSPVANTIEANNGSEDNNICQKWKSTEELAMVENFKLLDTMDKVAKISVEA
ncbi:ADP-ribosylation factor-like protein 13B [Argonauta hians]